MALRSAIHWIRPLLRDERGNALMFTALAMPLLIGCAGLAVDTIKWVYTKRDLQAAVDAAAMRVAREAQPDAKDPNWVSVRVEPVRPIGPVTLKSIKAEPKLAQMELLRQSRLSVAPVRNEEWKDVLEMAERS